MTSWTRCEMRKGPCPMGHRAKRTLLLLSILGLLCGGCATLTLRDAIGRKLPYRAQKHPRHSDGGYANQYHGKIKAGDAEYFAFIFSLNPFLTGDRPGGSGRHLGVLVPADSSAGKRAVAFEHEFEGTRPGDCAVRTEQISACLRKSRVPDNVIAAYSRVSCRTYWERDAYHAAAFTEFSREALFALKGYSIGRSFNAVRGKKVLCKHGEPEIVGFLLDEKEQPETLFLGKWPVTESDEPRWEWSGPYEVSACLTRPTWGQKLLPIGYVFTAAIDLATSPVQLPFFVALWIHGAP